MSVINTIKLKLQQLDPVHIIVEDQSVNHQGHQGLSEWEEKNGIISQEEQAPSHIKLLIVSELFTDKTLLQRHRMVKSLLAHELAEKIHAFTMKALTKKEYELQIF